MFIPQSRKRVPIGRVPYKSAKKGVGTLSRVSTFNSERAPMSCLQQLDALKGNNWTNNNAQHRCWQLSIDSTQHSEQHHDTVITV